MSHDVENRFSKRYNDGERLRCVEGLSLREMTFVISDMNVVSNEIEVSNEAEMLDDSLNEAENSSMNTLSKSFSSCMRVR